ncbi:MAG: hypothetical protein QE285_07135 [Aquabacterium sp.]|nr:hypothetical protein [Aquabacterium sp.]
MDSRLLSTLNARAGNTRDPVVWAKVVCRAASHFAAHGKTDEALIAIKNVRNQFGKDLHIDVASWLMLAEGVLHYFHARVPEAYDRIRRAYGLAIALRNNSAFPSCAAWMAQIEFESSKYDEMGKHLEEAFLTAQPQDYQAIARSSLTLATAYHIAGTFEMARPWYEKARLSAAAEGDDATVSATLHNMATLRASNVRLEDTFGGDFRKEALRVNLEAGSSLTYDIAIGHKGLDFLGQMLRGLIFTIDGKYHEGLAVFESIDIKAMPDRLRPLVLIDMAWCRIKTQDSTLEWSGILELERLMSAVQDADDLAYINSRLRQIADACNETAAAAIFASAADAALAEHRVFQVNLLKILEQVEKNPILG